MQPQLLQQKENYGCSILRASIELYLFVCTSEINLSFGLVGSVCHRAEFLLLQPKLLQQKSIITADLQHLSRSFLVCTSLGIGSFICLVKLWTSLNSLCPWKLLQQKSVDWHTCQASPPISFLLPGFDIFFALVGVLVIFVFWARSCQKKKKTNNFAANLNSYTTTLLQHQITHNHLSRILTLVKMCP